MTEFKKGDRVKVTVEGTVTEADRNWFDVGVNTFDTDVADNPRATGTKYTFEKLSDPEPVWVNGDVVKVAGWRLGYYFDGAWYGANRKLHIFSSAGGSAVTLSDYWQRGEVEIIVKDDKLVVGGEREDGQAPAA